MLDPNIQLCPFPDCESYAEKGKNKYVKCKQNNHQFCFNCLKNWHGNEKCKIDTDKSFENWKDSSKVKRCPNCKYFIEKTQGCNHMTCIYCKYQFCWLCMQKYDSEHFGPTSNCFGLQYSNRRCFSNRFCVFLYNVLIFFLKIIGFTILGPLLIFGFIFSEIDKKFYYRDVCLSKCLSYLSIILLCLSLYGLLILISGFLTFLICIIWPLIKKIYNLFCK